MTQMGLLSGVSRLSVLAGQADRLATLLLHNATLLCGQLPIRKTAETQRGGQNQRVTRAVLLHVK